VAKNRSALEGEASVLKDGIGSDDYAKIDTPPIKNSSGQTLFS
jgi:hypothetical protein